MSKPQPEPDRPFYVHLIGGEVIHLSEEEYKNIHAILTYESRPLVPLRDRFISRVAVCCIGKGKP